MNITADITGVIFGSIIKMVILYFIIYFLIKLAKLQRDQLFIVTLISSFVLDLILVVTIAKKIEYFIYDLLFIPIWMIFFFKNKTETNRS